MASCITSQFGNDYCPQLELTVTESSSTNTTSTLSWTLKYVAHGYAFSISARTYTVTIDGTVVKSASFNANGIKNTTTITSGTKTISKTTSAQKISFSISFPFNATWGGTYAGTKTASGSITVAAKPTYIISYNANGGSGAPGNQIKTYGVTLNLSTTTPTRTGYTFLGWSTSSSATSAMYAPGASYSTDASDVLYAVWKAVTYTVSYNTSGGR